MRYAVIALGAIGLIFGFLILIRAPMIEIGLFGVTGIILGIGLVLIGVKLRGIQL
jgi:hypothetical protein